MQPRRSHDWSPRPCFSRTIYLLLQQEDHEAQCHCVHLRAPLLTRLCLLRGLAAYAPLPAPRALRFPGGAAEGFCAKRW
eukprot:198380-Pyramimonas_sp.AAC.1